MLLTSALVVPDIARANLALERAENVSTLSFCTISTSGLIGIALARFLGQTWRLTPGQWRATIVFGLCQNALYLGLNFVAMQTVEASLASIIASTTDSAADADERLGYYASYNVSDAWIAYFEGSHSSEDDEWLLGASYTTTSGLNLTAEYFYNSSGIDDEIPEELIELIDLADFIQSVPNREAFSREHYMLLQAYQNDIFGKLDLLLRYTYNLDDHSRSLLGHLELDLNDYASFFTSATLNSSGGGELDSLREYWVQAGIELTF